MNAKLIELEKQLEELLNTHIADSILLAETSMEIGKLTQAEGLNDYVCRPLAEYKKLMESRKAESDKKNKIDEYCLNMILYAFKAFFNADVQSEGFEIVEDGHFIPTTKFSDQIVSRVGVQVLGVIIDVDWEDDFKLTFEACGDYGELLSKYKIPTTFTAHVSNGNASYSETFSTFEDIASNIWSIDVNLRNLWEQDESVVNTFIQELDKIATFLTLSYPLPPKK